MNPVAIMSLVELIRAAQTSDATFAASRALAARLGKTVCVSQDRPGFIINRVSSELAAAVRLWLE